MTSMMAAGYIEANSPDRADALVWPLSQLLLGQPYEDDIAKLVGNSPEKLAFFNRCDLGRRW